MSRKSFKPPTDLKLPYSSGEFLHILKKRGLPAPETEKEKVKLRAFNLLRNAVDLGLPVGHASNEETQEVAHSYWENLGVELKEGRSELLTPDILASNEVQHQYPGHTPQVTLGIAVARANLHIVSYYDDLPSLAYIGLLDYRIFNTL